MRDELLIVVVICEPRYVSPRARAQKTLELLQLGCHDPYPWQTTKDQTEPERTDAKVTVTEDIREWDYGDYEGITSQEIREKRKEERLGSWDIWKDGCPGGEYADFSLQLVCKSSTADDVWHGIGHQNRLRNGWTG